MGNDPYIIVNEVSGLEIGILIPKKMRVHFFRTHLTRSNYATMNLMAQSCQCDARQKSGRRVTNSY